MSDILDQLKRFRPDDMDERWTGNERGALAARIMQDDRSAAPRLRHLPRHRRRWVAATSMVAAGAAALIVVPAVLPDGTPGGASPAAAAALRDLARKAANAPVDQVEPGQFLHTVVREHQVGNTEGPLRIPFTSDSTFEEWRSPDGHFWTHQSGPGTAPGIESLYGTVDTRQAVSAMPTNADDLNRYLRKTVTGSNTIDEAVFVAIGGLMRFESPSPALRSAALEVLARTGHVRLDPTTVDELGRTVQQFDYIDEARRPGDVHSLCFDPATALQLDERDTHAGAISLTQILRTEVVDAVPAEVLRTAVPENGPMTGRR